MRGSVLADGSALEFHESERQELARSVWRIRNGFASFLASPVIRSFGAPGNSLRGLRYDLGCMSVANDTFEPVARMLEQRLDRLERLPFAWEPTLTLIVDNWRILHGRQTSSVDDRSTRRLQRVLIAGNNR
jgi:hypothetical protein